ncbi:MAG: outer membrane protein assembly factor BamD [Deltaproteobacteria bacterium]|nr:outer membrane protein assembly factor BamD [Deltaproteobacteria bacterium]
MKNRVLLSLLCVLELTACAKERFVVGKGGVDGDFQTCLALSEKKKFEEAIDCLEIYKSRYRGSKQAEEAELAVGDNFFRKKEYLLAAESYQEFIRNRPLHTRLDYAYYRLGLSYLMEAPKAIDRDQQYLDDAIEALATQLELFPNSSYREAAATQLTTARVRTGRRHYYIGRFYYRTGEYRAALPRLEEVIAHYAEVPELPQAYYQLVRSYARLGDGAGAGEVMAQMEQKLPDSPWTTRARKALRAVPPGTAQAMVETRGHHENQ